MKNLLLLGIVLAFSIPGLTQKRATIPNELLHYSIEKGQPISTIFNTGHRSLPSTIQNLFTPEETIIGNTYYDLQTTFSTPNRFHVYPDGTMAGVWTFGLEFPGFSNDRGTGYNYFDGESWEPIPTERIESVRTGWPSYTPYGENGELAVSHDFGDGTLYYLLREEKGVGEWSEIQFEGPAGLPISWNRTITSGVNHNVIHTICASWKEANGGSVYQGLDGALLYSRSSDGGVTWEPENIVLDGLTANEYFGFTQDIYDWAVADGDNIAFLSGEFWIDLVLMKSTDGGDSWEKTVIWEHPYPMFNPAEPIVTDTFYCVDGSHHLAFDNEGKIHVVFGINRTYSDGAQTFWYPGVGGIGYWNENRPTFSNDMNALCPLYDNCSYSELIEDYSLVGWTQDVNNNGTIDVFDEWVSYYLGFSSMPQIHINDNNEIILVFSSVTETYDNGICNYRHLWSRFSPNGDFWGPFIDLTSEMIHIYDECIYPSIASISDEYFYLTYQTDDQPGLALRDDHPYNENFTRFMKVDIDEVWTGKKKNTTEINFEVLQNHPNPFNNKTTIQLKLAEPGIFKLEVTNLTGKKVYENNLGYLNTGTHNILHNVPALKPGVYFYTVKDQEQSVTKKMIVK